MQSAVLAMIDSVRLSVRHSPVSCRLHPALHAHLPCTTLLGERIVKIGQYLAKIWTRI